ncbi:MAG: acyl carrier protein [Bdellovibrionales bacterium]|nr:acyl carrier protein [Bdellovibrionales bacterium]
MGSDFRTRIREKLLTDELYSSMLPEDFSDDFNLVRSGALDSLGMMNLVIFIEKEFSIPIEVVDLVEENFLTVNQIVSWMKSKGTSTLSLS